MMKILKRGKLLVFCALLCLLFATVASAAGTGDVASAVESTWTTASTQIKTVVDNVVFPVIDMVKPASIISISRPTSLKHSL